MDLKCTKRRRKQITGAFNDGHIECKSESSEALSIKQKQGDLITCSYRVGIQL